MKSLFVFLTFFVLANGYTPGIRVKFGAGDGIGESYYYPVPTTIEGALADGWKQYCRPPGPLPQLKLFCPEEMSLCILVDDTGYIAGIQVALPDTFTNNAFELRTQGFTKWDTTVDGNRTSLWTLQQYFVSKEGLSQSKEYRLKSRNSSRILQEGGVWLTGIHGKLLKVSTNEEDIKESLYTEQGCMPGMGQHYYYNLTSATECVSEQVYPWFSMAYQGQLVATGFMTFGEMTIKEGVRDWFEHPTRPLVQGVIVPYGPDCMYDLVDQPGAHTIHIYYTDDPQTITC